jgi:hypothetical protein
VRTGLLRPSASAQTTALLMTLMVKPSSVLRKSLASSSRQPSARRSCQSQAPGTTVPLIPGPSNVPPGDGNDQALAACGGPHVDRSPKVTVSLNTSSKLGAGCAHRRSHRQRKARHQ